LERKFDLEKIKLHFFEIQRKANSLLQILTKKSQRPFDAKIKKIS